MSARGKTRAVIAALLVLWMLLELASAISEAGSTATYASRDPGALIVIALLGVAASLAALHSAVGVARGSPRRIGERAGLTLIVLTVMLILLYMFAGLASGPL